MSISNAALGGISAFPPHISNAKVMKSAILSMPEFQISVTNTGQLSNKCPLLPKN
jgi:hypothetical protein